MRLLATEILFKDKTQASNLNVSKLLTKSLMPFTEFMKEDQFTIHLPHYYGSSANPFMWFTIARITLFTSTTRWAACKRPTPIEPLTGTVR
jgi:hypothetical protein